MAVDMSSDIEILPAASLVLLRDSPLEVLMIRRNDESGFVPGAWIFPGGAIDPADRELAAALGDESVAGGARVSAIRETLEETRVWLGRPECAPPVAGDEPVPLKRADIAEAFEALVPMSRWITPAGMPRRYDTHFFVARAPERCAPVVDGREGVEWRWVAPVSALTDHRERRMKLLFPTIRTLELLSRFDSVDDVIAHCAGSETRVHQPVMLSSDGKVRIFLPEEAQ